MNFQLKNLKVEKSIEKSEKSEKKHQQFQGLMNFDDKNSMVMFSFSLNKDDQIIIRKHIIEKVQFCSKKQPEYFNILLNACNIDLDQLDSMENKIREAAFRLNEKFELTINDIVLVKKPSSDKFEVSFTNEGYRKLSLYEFRNMNRKSLLPIEPVRIEKFELQFNDGKFKNLFDDPVSLGAGSFGIVF